MGDRYRRLGTGRPLILLNGLAATSDDWDPSFIDRLAFSNELVLPDNRGIGASNDDGAPFDIAKLADDTARVIKALDFERASVLGWSMGGFIAQTLALNDSARVHKLILLSTDPGGSSATTSLYLKTRPTPVPRTSSPAPPQRFPALGDSIYRVRRRGAAPRNSANLIIGGLRMVRHP
jgi:pimeloyl-ACP methyl ester carboxylesterase